MEQTNYLVDPGGPSGGRLLSRGRKHPDHGGCENDLRDEQRYRGRGGRRKIAGGLIPGRKDVCPGLELAVEGGQAFRHSLPDIPIADIRP